jgi:hypothetical protein
MTRVTDWLVKASDRLIPGSSDQLLRLIHPASFQVSRQETREIALAFIWGTAVIVGMIFMLLLSAGGNAISQHAGDDGLLVGLFLTWFSFGGLVLHATRYVAALTTRNSIERRYSRRFGKPSSKNAALGQQVQEERPRVLLAITRSTDWDLAIQGLLGVALTIATH